MNRKETAWFKINLILVLWLVPPTGLVVLLSDSLPKWMGIGWGLVFITCWFAFLVLLAFGPARFVERFPARVRPQARMILQVLMLWMVGFLSLSVADDILPQRALTIYGLSVLFLPWLAAVVAHFGLGPLGKGLTKAAKQDERESWRS